MNGFEIFSTSDLNFSLNSLVPLLYIPASRHSFPQVIVHVAPKDPLTPR